MRELTTDTLEQFIQEHDKVIVQYGASWCGVCRIVKPKFAALADSNQNVQFVYIDAENLPNSRKLAEVENLPTFAGFTGGKLVKQTSGAREQAIVEVLDEVTSH